MSLQDARVDGEALLRPADAPQGLHEQDAKRVLHGAMDLVLTDRQRDALYAELGGLSPTVLAERMGTSKGALYKLLHDARKRLRTYFEQQGIRLNDLVEAS
jgi:RNA polymerase sigma-70 factor (ECF subfamily)